MSSRDDILARLQAHAIAPEKRPEMDFEPLAFDNPVEQFERILKVAGANSLRLEPGQDVNDELLDTIQMIATIMNGMQGDTAYGN